MRRAVASLLLCSIAVATACVAEGAEPSAAVEAPARAPSVAAAEPAPAAIAAEPVDLGDAPLPGAHPSLDALGRAMIDALNANDRAALLGLSVSAVEFKGRLFDALIQHPNAYQMGADLLWDMHIAESNGELRRALSRYGGKNLAFESIAVEREEERKGLVFHKRPRIVAKDADGNEYKLEIVGTIIEHPASGGFIALSFRMAD